jgi:Beta protein
MAEHNHYVPILKGKQGEFTALAALDDAVRGGITPLIEVAPVPWDWESETPAKSLEAHLHPVAGNIAKAWRTTRPVFVELAWIAEDSMGDGSHPVASVLTALRTAGVQAIPVTGMGRSDPYAAAVRDVIAEDGRGVCVRLERDDLRSVNLLADGLDATCAALDARPGEVDLILDFKDFDGGQAPVIEMAAGVALSALPRADEWRSLTLAGGAFPVNLTGIQGEARIPRADWDVWRALAIDRANELPRRPAFADYAVQHPEPEEIDPRLMRMSAAVRYATPNDWLILKKKNVRDHGFDQFHDISAELAQRSEFRGADFSGADRAIQDCADRSSGPGNATTWRWIATNHHIATVVDQIANLP